GCRLAWLGQRGGERAEDARARVLDRALEEAAGGAGVAAAAERRADRAGVDPSLGAERGADAAVARRREEDAALHALDGAGIVDQPLGVLPARAAPPHHLVGDDHDGDAAVELERDAGERLREEAPAGERDLLAERLGDLPRAHAEIGD